MEQTLQRSDRRVGATPQRSLPVSPFDRITAGLIVVLAMLPFGPVYNLPFSFVILNAFEIIYLFLVLVLCAKIIVVRRVKFPGSFLFFCGLAFIYMIYSSVSFGVPFVDSLRMLRLFAPFGVATLVIAAGFRFPTATYLNLMVIAALISSASALFIQYIAQDFLETALSASEDIYLVATQYGRLYWSNIGIAFFAMLALFVEGIKTPRVVIVFVVVASLIAVFAASSRTTFLGIPLFLTGAVCVAGNFTTAIKRVLMGTFVAISLVAIGFALARFDERIADLVDLRIFGRGDMFSVYESSFVETRLEGYQGYVNNIKTHFPLGQGLGRPLSIRGDGIPVLTSDISIISFTIPFGVPGFFFFAFFVWRLVSLIQRAGPYTNPKTRKIVLVMLAVFFLMALNEDFFSRNNFIIWFAALVMSLNPNSGKSLGYNRRATANFTNYHRQLELR